MQFPEPFSRGFVQQLKARILNERWRFTMCLCLSRREWSILQGRELE